MIWSKSKTDRLGDSMRRSETPSDDDLAAYAEMVQERYADVVQETFMKLLDAGFVFTSRFPKTAGTLVEKLKRDRTRLSTIQDIAGARIVIDGGRGEQDATVQEVVNCLAGFADCEIVDRRDDPSHGYRAVHVIARVQGVALEIQVRTALQDQWANIMEKFADIYGRQVRYGMPPNEASEKLVPDLEVTPQSLLDLLLWRADRIDQAEILEVEIGLFDLDTDVADEHLEMLGIDGKELDEESKVQAVKEELVSQVVQSKDGLVESLKTIADTLSLIEKYKSAQGELGE